MGIIKKVLDDALGYVDAILGRTNLRDRVSETASKPAPSTYEEKIQEALEAGDLQSAGLLQLAHEIYSPLGGVGDVFSNTAREDTELVKSLYGDTPGHGEIYLPDNVGSYQGLRWYGQERKYKLLRSAARRDPIMSSILQLRTDQISRFARRPKDKADNSQKGLVVRKEDKDAQEEDRFADLLLDFLLGLGDIENPYDEDLGTVLEMATRDLITLDKITVELMQSRGKGPRGVKYLDPATIFYYEKDSPEFSQGYRFCQVLWEGRGRVSPTQWPKFRGDELVAGVSNPISDIMRRGEGISVVEMLSSVMATMIRGLNYNSRAFTEGSVPPGILNLSGNYSNQVLRQFVNRIKANAAGQNFKIPVISTKEGTAQFIPFGQTNKDLEYNQLLQLLITIECSAAQVDPSEIGFSVQYGGSASVFGRQNEQTRIEEGKDRGLSGLLEFLAKWLTRVIHKFPKGKDYIAEFTGHTSQDTEKEAQIQAALLQAGISLPYESRKAMGLPPIPELPEEAEEEYDPSWVFAPVNAGSQQIWMQANMEEEGGMGGAGVPTGDEEYDSMMAQALGGQGQQPEQGQLPPGQGQQLALPPGQGGAPPGQPGQPPVQVQKAVGEGGRTLKVYEITLPDGD